MQVMAAALQGEAGVPESLGTATMPPQALYGTSRLPLSALTTNTLHLVPPSLVATNTGMVPHPVHLNMMPHGSYAYFNQSHSLMVREMTSPTITVVHLLWCCFCRFDSKCNYSTLLAGPVANAVRRRHIVGG